MLILVLTEEALSVVRRRRSPLSLPTPSMLFPHFFLDFILPYLLQRVTYVPPTTAFAVHRRDKSSTQMTKGFLIPLNWGNVAS